MSKTDKATYATFLNEIKEKIHMARHDAMRQVNRALLALYWEIGKSIVEKQREHGWGRSVVESLSKDLQSEFAGVQGYSSQNLWYMRQLYLEYRESEKLQPLVGEISWSNNIVIISKCKDEQEREFYMRMTRKYGWTKSVLTHQIEGRAYEKFLLNQTNFDRTLEERYRHQARLAVKDSYSFDFLEMSEQYSERELELGLIGNIRRFLMEMGGDFAFMGNQYRLKVGEEEFYIDLLLYHRRLKSLIAIELKTTAFRPEYAGKMQFYLTALNETVRTGDENASIGIIICKEKDRTTVEYALKDMSGPMGVATYTVREQLPENMRELLPSPEEIAESLEKLME